MVRFFPTFLWNSSLQAFGFVFILFGFSTVKAQTDRQPSKTQIGLDLGKTIYYNVLPNARGFHLEAPCRFRLNSDFTLMGGVGYGYLQDVNHEFFPEFKTLRKTGFIGLEVNIYKQFGFMGTSYMISRVKKYGRYQPEFFDPEAYVLQGPFDFTETYGSIQVYNLWMIGLSTHFKLGLKLFGMLTPSRNSAENHFYNEYTRDGLSTVPTDYFLSTGLNVHLYYTFLKKP